MADAYDEDAFQHLLAIEQKRSERSNRPFFVLLLSVNASSGATTPIESPLARRLFSALWQCVRETDFIGWYRDGQVLGAVLTHSAGAPPTQLAQVVSGRLQRVLRAGFPSDLSRRVHVRVYEGKPTLNDRR